MRSSRTRSLIAIALGFAVALGTTSCATEVSPPTSSEPTTRTIVDGEGREVEIPAEVDRVVATNSYILELLFAFGVKDTVVGLDRQSIDRVTYAELPPDLPVVAERYQDPFDYEAIIGANPQLVFTPTGSAWEEAAAKLEPYGIAVVVITPFQPDLWEDSIRIVQDVFGESPVGQKVFDLTEQVLGALESHAPQGEWKTFYAESPYNSPEYTIGGNTGVEYVISQRAYLDNRLWDGLTEDLGTITVDPEDVLAADPDVIFIYWDVTYGGTSRDELQDALDHYLARPGWQNLTAVKNKNVWAYNGWSTAGVGRNLSSLIRASWAYPDEFADVDIDGLIRQWVELLGAEYTDEADYVLKLS